MFEGRPSWRISFLMVILITGGVLEAQEASKTSTNSRGQLVFTMRHQPAAEAVSLVLPLLSAEGSVELRPGGNTLAIRDQKVVLERIRRVLINLDHPREDLRVEIRLIRAQRPPVSGVPEVERKQPAALQLPAGHQLPFEGYESVGETVLNTREGETLEYRVGGDYWVSFRVGTMLAHRRIKFYDFVLKKAEKRGAPQNEAEPLRMILNLWKDKTTVLGVSPDGDQALMIVLKWSLPQPQSVEIRR